MRNAASEGMKNGRKVILARTGRLTKNSGTGNGSVLSQLAAAQQCRKNLNPSSVGAIIHLLLGPGDGRAVALA